MTMLRQLFAAIILVESLSLSIFAGSPEPQPGQIKNLVTFGDSYTDIDGHDDGGIVWPVFAAEIGTNDVGANALLTGGQTPGVTVVDTTACAVNWVRALYDGGARNFVFQNMIPLETVPLYAPGSYPNLYWNARRNTTEWSVFMRELTTSGNAIARLQLQLLAPALKGAHIGLFDSHSLFADMYTHPQRYLNGTGPFNVTGAAHACVFQENESQHDPGMCTDAPDPDSYLWWDELHPSVQASRVVAKAISDAIHRRSEEWITWLS